MRLPWILLLGFSWFTHPAPGQRPYQSIARDTIIARPGFLSDTYLLDGKRLNLQVMQFFMSDHPAASARLKGAILTDQLSLAGYSIGGLFLFTGALIGKDNTPVSRDLYLYGGVGVGVAMIFQIISNNFRREAVGFYNDDIKAVYRDKRVGVVLDGRGVGVFWSIVHSPWSMVHGSGDLAFPSDLKTAASSALGRISGGFAPRIATIKVSGVSVPLAPAGGVPLGRRSVREHPCLSTA